MTLLNHTIVEFGIVPGKAFPRPCTSSDWIFFKKVLSEPFTSVEKMRVILSPVQTDVFHAGIIGFATVTTTNQINIWAKNVGCDPTRAGFTFLVIEETENLVEPPVIGSNIRVTLSKLTDKTISPKCTLPETYWDGNILKKKNWTNGTVLFSPKSKPGITSAHTGSLTSSVNTNGTLIKIKAHNLLSEPVNGHFFSTIWQYERNSSLYSDYSIDSGISYIKPNIPALGISLEWDIVFNTPFSEITPVVLVSGKQYNSLLKPHPLVFSVKEVTKTGFRVSAYNAACDTDAKIEDRLKSTQMYWIAIGK